jgi:hypothetical protein
MLLDTLKGYECRHATAEELEEMYALLEPLVCDEAEHKNIFEMTQRKLRKYLKYAIKTKQAVIVVKNGVITSAYAGDKSVIVYMGTKGSNIISTTILIHTVLNRLHNRFAESEFQVANEQQRRAWEVTALGEDAVSIDEYGVGQIKLVAKERIERLYNALKG